MPSRYTFRKLYADAVAADGTVAVLYLTSTRLWRRWHNRAGVELYHPDGRYERIDLPAPEAPLDGSGRFATETLRFATPRGVITYSVTDPEGDWTPRGCPVDSLVWRVHFARAKVEFALYDRVVTGDGYADFVEMTDTPRAMGLKTLQWGRVHLPGRTLVFEDLGFSSGALWQIGLDRTPGDRAESRPVIPSLDTRGSGAVRVGDTVLTITPTRVLHEGNALEARRVPSIVDRMAAWVASGTVTQSRYLGVARTPEGLEGVALYERVRFGARP